ncbi:MAG: hypothetical protein BWY93_01693 [Euryarchaeota archaeon ADurb.BinA087]|nr:MAG: hypothetical protein BWY93_01693 [Euryarchaeota archaeon ADurb.BinA087]
MKFTNMQVIAIIRPPPIAPVMVATTTPISAAQAPPKRPARPAPAASIATPVAIPGACPMAAGAPPTGTKWTPNPIRTPPMMIPMRAINARPDPNR